MSDTPFAGNNARFQETSDPVLSSWFDGGKNETAESKSLTGAFSGREQPASLRNQISNQEMFSAFKEANSRAIDAPGLPKLSFNCDLGQAESMTAARPESRPTPFQQVSDILGSDSQSSRLLGERLLSKFTAADCIMDMSLSPDGTVSAALKASDGYRRTVVCRPDGKTSQRITGPRGEEIVQFTSSGQVVTSLDLKREGMERTA